MRITAMIATLLSFIATPAMSDDLNAEMLNRFKEIAYYTDVSDLERCTKAFADVLQATEFGKLDRNGYVYKTMWEQKCFDIYADFGDGAEKAGFRNSSGPAKKKEFEVSLRAGVLGIHFSSFDPKDFEDPALEIRRQLAKLGDDWPVRTQYVYFDLRGNLGGYINLAQRVIELFAPGPGISFMRLNAQPKTTAPKLSRTVARGILAGYPLTFLIDRDTCSSSELVINTVHEWDAASRIVGPEHTCGKAIVQEIDYFGPKNFVLKVTSGHWITPHDWHRVGIQPTRIANLDRCRSDYVCIHEQLSSVQSASGQ